MVDEMGVLGSAVAAKVLDLHDLGQHSLVEVNLKRGCCDVPLEHILVLDEHRI